MKWIALAKARGWDATCRILQVLVHPYDVVLMYLQEYVHVLESLKISIQHHMMWWIHIQHSMMWLISIQHPMLQTSDVSLWPQRFHLVIKICLAPFTVLLSKYCTHQMSGLGSGMPKVYQWLHNLQQTSGLMSVLHSSPLRDTSSMSLVLHLVQWKEKLLKKPFWLSLNLDGCVTLLGSLGDKY